MSTCVPESFNKLFFTESILGDPVLVDDALTVRASGVFPLGGYPVTSREGSLSGNMIFKGVVSSSRTVTEYIGDPRNPEGFKEPYKVIDIIRNSEGLTIHEYAFEGGSENPEAWIDNWVVLAESFEFQLDEKGNFGSR